MVSNNPKEEGHSMNYSLKTKLTLSYIFVALVSSFLLSICANLLLEKYFTDYVSTNLANKNENIVKTLSQQYTYYDGFNREVVEVIGINALESGIIMQIIDSSDEVVWDARTHNNGMCQGIVLQMSENMHKRYPFFHGEYEEIPYSIYDGIVEVGTVLIGGYGPYYFNETDLLFISTLNKFIIAVTIVSLVFSILIGAIMARKLSLPITKAIKSAQMISKGFYANRITEKSTTKEMNQLTVTINELAENLEKQDQLRRRLTSDVSHELRTPLATLQSHFEAMIDGIWETSTERLLSCHEEIIRMNKMVGDLEQLTKFESDNLIINKIDFDLTQLMGRIVQNYEAELATKNLKLNLEVEQITLHADKDKITQVLINLISNAIKFTQEGGIITIYIHISKESVCIHVKDNGIGVPQSEQALIFERFYRTDQSRTRLTGGSGIGLTIVKSIVEAHNGTIELISEREQGSEFIVKLPLKK